MYPCVHPCVHPCVQTFFEHARFLVRCGTNRLPTTLLSVCVHGSGFSQPYLHQVPACSWVKLSCCIECYNKACSRARRNSLFSCLLDISFILVRLGGMKCGAYCLAALLTYSCLVWCCRVYCYEWPPHRIDNYDAVGQISMMLQNRLRWCCRVCFFTNDHHTEYCAWASTHIHIQVHKNLHIHTHTQIHAHCHHSLIASLFSQLLPAENQEATQILHYVNGQKYEPHNDFFHDAVNSAPATGGQRVATVLMYLWVPSWLHSLL